MTGGAAPYALQDRRLDLGDGRSVRLYNVIRLEGGGAASAGVQYGSALPLADVEGRRLEAAAVIRYFGPFFEADGARSATAQVCGTPEQAAMQEAPDQIFLFELRDGTWTFVGDAGPPPRSSRPSA